MKRLNENQYILIKSCLSLQRRNVQIWNLDLINAVVYGAEHGCKWRALPRKFGNWHTIDTPLKRWAEKGVLEQLIKISAPCLGIENTSIKGHPDAAGDPQAIAANGSQKVMWLSQMIWIDVLSFFGAGGRREKCQAFFAKNPPFNDEGNKTREWVEHYGLNPVVPPQSNRLKLWGYDKTIYKRRNEIERLFTVWPTCGMLRVCGC